MLIFIDILLLTAITLIPALELRASIPVGIVFAERFGIDLNGFTVVIVCVIANILLGWAVFWILGPILRFFEHFDWFRKMIDPILLRTQRKIHPYVEKYGEIGVAVFIGIPLPGSGVYTGALGAFLLGLDRKKFAIANVIGVLIAATVVTAISLAIAHGMDVPSWLEWIIKEPAAH
jgi:uncharacterized membrane protein